jgi:glycosyltransferase involved in cell wall biosynthesis
VSGAPRASLIIPLYNTAATLRRTLAALDAQRVPVGTFEAIVVDDGSTDSPRETARRFLERPWLTWLEHGSNRGPAAARNTGLERARGELLIFCDGDTVPRSDYVVEHLRAHEAQADERCAVLGLVVAGDAALATPLKRLGDPTVSWHLLASGRGPGADWRRFATGNLSLRRSFLASERFDDKTFSGIGYEDTELGFRLAKRGLRIVFHAAAVSEHVHYRTPAEFLRKSERYGAAFARWERAASPADRKVLRAAYHYSPDLREALRRLVVNGVTAPVILGLARAFEPVSEAASAFLYFKLYKHLSLVGYRRERRRLGSSVRGLEEVAALIGGLGLDVL